MDEGGVMNGPIPEKYRGLDRFDCRKAVVEDMTALGLVEKIEEHHHAVGHCYRCHTVVEPYYSDQWFVRMKPLAEAALAAAVDDRVRFYPERWTQDLYRLDGKHPRLVHLAPDLVGPPHPGLVLRVRRSDR